MQKAQNITHRASEHDPALIKNWVTMTHILGHPGKKRHLASIVNIVIVPPRS